MGNITNSQWTLILLFVIVFSSISFLKNKNVIELILLLFFSGMLGAFVYRFMDYQKLNTEIIGKFIVEKDFIQINDSKFDFNKIYSIYLNINHFCNEEQYMWDRYRFNPQYYIGKGNYFEIITKDNKEYKGEFLINSRMDFLKLKNLELK